MKPTQSAAPAVIIPADSPAHQLLATAAAGFAAGATAEAKTAARTALDTLRSALATSSPASTKPAPPKLDLLDLALARISAALSDEDRAKVFDTTTPLDIPTVSLAGLSR